MSGSVSVLVQFFIPAQSTLSLHLHISLIGNPTATSQLRSAALGELVRCLQRRVGVRCAARDARLRGGVVSETATCVSGVCQKVTCTGVANICVLCDALCTNGGGHDCTSVEISTSGQSQVFFLAVD